jgi:hypothetical protein
VKFLHWVFAYIAVGLSAGLAAWSGMQAASEPADAYIKGAIMFVIALLGCHGWGWAAKTWNGGHRVWATIAGVVLTVAMLVTLIGGAGSFYSAANVKIAKAERGGDAYARADVELKKIARKIESLTKHRTKGEIAPDIEVAKSDRRFKSTDGCAPGKVTKSLEFCRGYQALQTELAAAAAEEALEAKAAPYRAIVGSGKPASAGGWGALLGAAFGIPEATGNALFSIMCTVALDLGAVVAVLTAELRHGHTQPAPTEHSPNGGRMLDRLFTRRKPEPVIDITPAPVPEPARVPERPRPRLAITTRQPIGAVLDFLHQGVKLTAGARTGMAEAFVAYQAWCAASNLKAMTVAEFFQAMSSECSRFKIAIVEDGGKRWLVNVQLKQDGKATA